MAEIHTNMHKTEKHWIVVQLYKLIWIWCVSLPEALDVCTFLCVCVALLRRSNAVWLGPVLSAEQRHGRSTSASLHKCWGGQGCSSSSPTVWRLKVQSPIVGAHQLCVLTQGPTLKTPFGFAVQHPGGECWIFSDWSKVMLEKKCMLKKRYMYFYFIIISILLPSCLFLEGFLQTGLSQPVTENKAHTKDEKKTARNYFNICRLVCACVCVSMRRSVLSIYSGRVSFSTIVMRRW